MNWMQAFERLAFFFLSSRVCSRVTLYKVMSVLCQTFMSAVALQKNSMGETSPCSRAVVALGVCVTIICDEFEGKLSE